MLWAPGGAWGPARSAVSPALSSEPWPSWALPGAPLPFHTKFPWSVVAGHLSSGSGAEDELNLYDESSSYGGGGGVKCYLNRFFIVMSLILAWK